MLAIASFNPIKLYCCLNATGKGSRICLIASKQAITPLRMRSAGTPSVKGYTGRTRPILMDSILDPKLSKTSNSGLSKVNP